MSASERLSRNHPAPEQQTQPDSPDTRTRFRHDQLTDARRSAQPTSLFPNRLSRTASTRSWLSRTATKEQSVSKPQKPHPHPLKKYFPNSYTRRIDPGSISVRSAVRFMDSDETRSPQSSKQPSTCDDCSQSSVYSHTQGRCRLAEVRAHRPHAPERSSAVGYGQRPYPTAHRRVSCSRWWNRSPRRRSRTRWDASWCHRSCTTGRPPPARSSTPSARPWCGRRSGMAAGHRRR